MEPTHVGEHDGEVWVRLVEEGGPDAAAAVHSAPRVGRRALQEHLAARRGGHRLQEAPGGTPAKGRTDVYDQNVPFAPTQTNLFLLRVHHL